MLVSNLLFIFGFSALLAGFGRRYALREESESEIEKVKRERKNSIFWGYSTEEEDKEIDRIVAERNNWKDRFKYELTCWGMDIICVVIFIGGVVAWFGDDKNHTWDELSNNAINFIVLAVAVWVFYIKRGEKIYELDAEIDELNHMLKVVKDQAVGMRKGSIIEYLELKDRLDKLEKK